MPELLIGNKILLIVMLILGTKPYKVARFRGAIRLNYN